MIVKICGFTRAEDAVAAVRAGADWLGLNFWPGSRRAIGIARGREIAAAVRDQAEAGAVALVGVFVSQPIDEVAQVAAAVGLDWVQLHGLESPEECATLARQGQDAGFRVLKAVAMATAEDVARTRAYPTEAILIDTPSAGHGGSGRTFDWSLAAAVVGMGRRVLLAGGLGPDNVAAAVAQVAPFGVDVASGVESSPGIKDPVKMEQFVRRAKGIRQESNHE